MWLCNSESKRGCPNRKGYPEVSLENTHSKTRSKRDEAEWTLASSWIVCITYISSPSSVLLSRTPSSPGAELPIYPSLERPSSAHGIVKRIESERDDQPPNAVNMYATLKTCFHHLFDAERTLVSQLSGDPNPKSSFCWKATHREISRSEHSDVHIHTCGSNDASDLGLR